MMVISEADKAVFATLRYYHPHPIVQRKMEALWLKSQGVKDKTILSLSAISRATLFRYYKDYREGGIDKLKQIDFYQPKSGLEKHASSLDAYFPAKEAAAKIEELTGIKKSETQVRPFSKSLGLRPRKIGMIPAKAGAKQGLSHRFVRPLTIVVESASSASFVQAGLVDRSGYSWVVADETMIKARRPACIQSTTPTFKRLPKQYLLVYRTLRIGIKNSWIRY